MTDETAEQRAEEFALKLEDEIEDCQYGDVTNKVRHLVKFAYEQGRLEGMRWMLKNLEEAEYPLFGIPAGNLITSEEFRERIGFKQGLVRVLEKAKELCGK